MTELNFDVNDLSNSELGDLLVECFRSTKLYSKVFMPERFRAEFSPIHDEIFDLIDSGEKRIVIAAPRGVGKTSICISYASKEILYREINYLPYVGQSEKLAVMQTENLKRELITNEIIKKLFGSIKAGSGSKFGVDESFSKTGWVAKLNEKELGTYVLPRGAGQAVRGILFGAKRPDLIIVDDFEDSRQIENEEIRRSWKTWFHADLEKAVSRVDKDWRIIYIDTLKHEDALIQELLESSAWTGVRLELCNDRLESNCPTFYSNAEIAADYAEHEKNGQLDVFAREYRNIPIDSRTQSFKPEFFKRYSEPSLAKLVGGSPSSKLRNIVLVDPAKTASLHSADSAVVGVGVDREGRGIYVRDVVSGKFYPDELYKEMFDMLVRLNAHVLAVEVTGLEEFIKQPIKNYGRVANINPIYKWLKARRSKEERIASLVPYYRQGYMFHNEACCQQLESQLQGFPRSKLWDVMDCLAYIVEVLEMDEHYFEAADYEENDDESVYDELENESAVADWRIF